MNKIMNRKLMAIIFSSAMMLFLYGCGTAPTGVEMQDSGVAQAPGPPPGDGGGDHWW